ncbi:MAG: Segregation and condensation protein B [Candidatus Wolfebacteria bacterium GW2011_GWA2_42_10]|uniref:Segregation and condensation protein B n=2 Tax=Candidatus Wolfeibacteriota TaxID=1752735 RepID=A0A0G0XLA3_9BACT|nr:MAG: Segregation and condensation protein B [Candidatus Wolfebacteria bacterium GW2011_GWB1_41_12]KKS25660.1 MAG: Segregation and condensation protein B [Candidatus Wolfebacteria bacterium GW2011_GWA2_42_10]KKT56451.1 MAG: Segregation and condensation protein B [Candidatus Wolfebacteria bacterium GW2011_GWA1_44_24]
MRDKNLTAAVEAILFAYGEPLEIKKIAKILNQDEKTVKEAAEKLNQYYLLEETGIKLIFSDNRLQLATKPEFSHLFENFIKEEFRENLTPAALETISLIAYLGPISRVQLDYFRGVNSSFILRSLLMRGLIERSTETKERSYAYRLSFDALKHLGISKIEELPEYEKFKTIADGANPVQNNFQAV